MDRMQWQTLYMPHFSWMLAKMLRFQMPDFVLSGICICQLATMLSLDHIVLQKFYPLNTLRLRRGRNRL